MLWSDSFKSLICGFNDLLNTPVWQHILAVVTSLCPAFLCSSTGRGGEGEGGEQAAKDKTESTQRGGQK